jgi:hypothetical protein
LCPLLTPTSDLRSILALFVAQAEETVPHSQKTSLSVKRFLEVKNSPKTVETSSGRTKKTFLHLFPK